MELVNGIFDLLRDGEWHDLTEMSEGSGSQDFMLEIVTNFLAEYDFVELDKSKRKVRLAESIIDFLKRIKHIEEDEKQKRVKLREVL
ncbi:MAG: hypothetical protein PVF15_05990 [Candidatus Bathyarchaeota archaeon]